MDKKVKCVYCNKYIHRISKATYLITDNDKSVLLFCSKECENFFKLKIVRHCANCDKLLNKRNIVRHTNIYNKPMTSFFCCNECKVQWIHNISIISNRLYQNSIQVKGGEKSNG